MVVATQAELQEAMAALGERVEDYVVKPVNPEGLRVSVARALQRRQLAAQKQRSEAAFPQLGGSRRLPDRDSPRGPHRGLFQPLCRRADRLSGVPGHRT